MCAKYWHKLGTQYWHKQGAKARVSTGLEFPNRSKLKDIKGLKSRAKVDTVLRDR